MPKKSARPVALGIVHCPTTRRILMVTSRNHPGLWIFPKGGVEKGETSAQAAARESAEEAGIPKAIPARNISELLVSVDMPPTKSQKHGEVWHVHAIVLEAESDLADDWLEKGQRAREWVTSNEALARIDKWGPKLSLELAEVEPEAAIRGSSSKKAMKADGMKLALESFINVYG